MVGSLKLSSSIPSNSEYQDPTETSKQSIRTHYLGHVTSYQPVRDQSRFLPKTYNTNITQGLFGDVSHIAFHPVAEGLLLAAEGSCTSLYDITTQRKALTLSNPSPICRPSPFLLPLSPPFLQALTLPDAPATTVSWSYDGRMACCTDKSGVIRVVDVRAGRETASALLMDQHKDVQHCWLGVDKILLAGYKNKERCFKTVSVGSLSSEISTLSHGRGSGNPFSLWDEDTRMVFLYAKGNHGFTYAEIGDTIANTVTNTDAWARRALFLRFAANTDALSITLT
eukprot:sb/3467832/